MISVASAGLDKVYQDTSNSHWVNPPDDVTIRAEVYVVKVFDAKTGETLWFPLGTADHALHIADEYE